MTKKKESCNHNQHYYEKGRNGWTPSSTEQVSSVRNKKNDDKEEMMGYVKELETYVNEMEGYLTRDTLDKISPPESDNFSLHLDSLSSNITNLLKEKNKSYGNTALNPPKIFSKLSSTEGICARIDDKLSRIQNKGINDKTEDTIDDLIGYLFLLKMSIK
jgi:hypothetical protein